MNKIRKMKIYSVLFAIALGCGISPASAQEVTEKYANLADFRAAVQQAVSQYGPPTKATESLGSVPQTEPELNDWMKWGYSFVSDEPSKCTNPAPSYEYSYSRTRLDPNDPKKDPAVDECYVIDAASRTKSRQEKSMCDQQNASDHFCFDVY